ITLIAINFEIGIKSPPFFLIVAIRLTLQCELYESIPRIFQDKVQNVIRWINAQFFELMDQR
ncbi:MAG: hypothetical protein IKX30_10800, partial [Victivallales bacterium]|nr:hypothetical protein [Victivallales bacterium]